jgi:hypothetical protein
MGQGIIHERRSWVQVDQIAFHVDDISHVGYHELYPISSELTLSQYENRSIRSISSDPPPYRLD